MSNEFNFGEWIDRKVKLKDLKPDPTNPRTITADALEGLEESMKAYPNMDPIVWNERTGHVVGGHQRLRVMRKHMEPDDEVRVIVVDLSPEEEKLANITLNNPAIQGKFDASKLEELKFDVPQLKDGDTLRALRMESLFIPPPETKAPQLKTTFEVVVECSDEAHLKRVFEDLQGAGYKCRVLTL